MSDNDPFDFDHDDDWIEPVDGDEEAAAFDELPSTGLFSFYDRLRERVLEAAEAQAGSLGEKTAETLLLAPDVFFLLVRLSFDREVPKGTRALIGGALAYFVLPTDFFPEAIVGAPGYVDDVVLAAAVLSQAFQRELEPLLQRHWSGSQELRHVLGDVLVAAEALLGQDLWARIRKTLAKRGVSVEA